MKSRWFPPLLVLAVALAPAAGCRSAPAPASPGRPEFFSGGLAGQSVGSREEGAVIGESGGCLMGYVAATKLGDGPDAAHAATPEHRRARDLFSLAIRTGSRDRAIRLLRQAVEIDPGHAAAHNDLGLLLLCAGDTAGAREALETAIAKDPAYRPARHNLDRLVAEGR